jgi:hypothetical protein
VQDSRADLSWAVSTVRGCTPMGGSRSSARRVHVRRETGTISARSLKGGSSADPRRRAALESSSADPRRRAALESLHHNDTGLIGAAGAMKTWRAAP